MNCGDTEINDKTMSGKVISVQYHFPCPDGAFGAFAAHLYFECAGQLPENAKLSFSPQRVELTPSTDIDESVTDVYLIDWIGSTDNVLRWAASAKNVVLLDHHKTAIDSLAQLDLPQNVQNRSAVEHSGAMLAWNYFSDLVTDVELRDRVFTPELRRLFEYVEDRDLWHNALPDSKAVSTAIATANYNFDVVANPRLWAELGAIGLESMRLAGLQQLATTEAAVAAELKNAFRIEFAGIVCLAVITERKSLRSEIGHALADRSAELQLAPIGAVAYVEASLNNADMLKVSLRSLGDTDTTEISARYGGGGHLNASSFNIHKNKFNSWIIKP